MKRTVRLVAVALTILCLVPVLAASLSANASSGDDGGTRYTEKIVSVLYDNSGSMRDTAFKTEHRSQYAEYALQVLMALLSPTDTLVITPMTLDGSVVSSTDQGFEVDLSSSDRDKEVKRIMDTYKTKHLAPYGSSTPAKSINVAVKQLTDRGMKRASEENEDISNKEYWLVVLTDGEFDIIDSGMSEEQKINTTVDYLDNYLADYTSLQMIYLGISKDALDLSQSDIAKGGNFSPYLAGTADKVTDAMQSIANRLSGRYTLPSYAISAVGSQVTIDLSSCSFPLRSVSFVAQNCGATLLSASYNGGNLPISQLCEVMPDAVLGLSNGCSAVISGDPLLTGGTLTLNFSGTVSADYLSVMVEPALYILPVMQCQENGQWINCDPQYVSDKLTEGDNIRMNYEVHEEGSGKPIDLEALFGTPTANVTAGGVNYAVNQQIPLKEGKNEITLAVSVMNGAYTIYATEYCYIEKDPSFYRVAGTITEGVDGSPTKSKSTFTVFVNNQPLDKAGFSEYTWKVEATDAAGTVIPVEAVLGDDGKVTAVMDTAGMSYGKCELTFTVTSPYNVSRSSTMTVKNNPVSIAVTLDSNDTLSMTRHEFKSNTEGFSFLLTADGKNIVFDNGITAYTVTVNGTDVTAHCTVEGNRLTYVPNAENASLGGSSGEGITATVKISVVGTELTALKAEATATITLMPTVYEVVAMPSDESKIDRFSLKKNETSAYFAVTRDGIYLTEEELTAALESGEFTVSAGLTDNFLLPAGEELTVTTLNGTPVIRYHVVSDHIGILRLFTAMFVFSGEKQVTLHYDNAEGVGTVTVGKASPWSYIWRVLLIILIIHIIMVIAFTKKSPRHKKGYLVRIAMGVGGRAYPGTVVIKRKNFDWKDRLVPGRLINPMAAQKPYTEERYAKVSLNKKDGNDMITISGVRESNCLRFRERDIVQTDKYETFKRCLDAIRAGQHPRFDRTGVDINTEQFRAMFPYALQHNSANAAMNVVSPGKTEKLASRVFYAVYDDSRYHNLQAIVFFIAR